jgi:ATP-binding cassette subfamily B protein
MTTIKSPECQAKNETTVAQMIKLAENPLSRLFGYLRPYRTKLYISIFYSFINKALDLAPPVLVGWAVDVVTRQPPAFIDYFAHGDILVSGLILGFLGFFIFGFESLFQWLYTLGFAQIAQELQHKLRLDAYAKMQQREFHFFENHSLGETMSMLSDDVNQLERFINNAFNDIVQLAGLFVFSAIILVEASPGLSLISIVPIPLVVWGALKFARLLEPRYKAVRQAVGHVNTRLENNIGGISVIKAFTAEDYELSRLGEASNRYRETNLKAIRLSAIFTPLIRMGIAASFGTVLVVGTVWTMNGSISPGTFTLFTMMCQRILWPLTRLGTILDETERCRASAARTFGLLDTPSSIVDRAGAINVERARGEIEFKDVEFSYGRGYPIFSGVNFKIHAKERIGFAGATGAGKSTIVKLLLRFYEPDSGAIKIDGKDINKFTLKSLREQISLVSQDVYIFQGTIRDNILYSTPHATEADLFHAAKKAQLHDFVMSLPDGYDSVVGERGIKLSGGQRQRLSIARALLKDAPILIMDEATSSVDTETERAIQTHLEEYTRDKTAIIIAHRLSTIRNCDRIFVLANGKLEQEGTHDSLIATQGLFADLWRVQIGSVR